MLLLLFVFQSIISPESRVGEDDGTKSIRLLLLGATG
jgi:hypothetical protein